MRREVLQVIFDRFVSRSDCYALQQEDGRYVCVKKPFGYSELRGHLAGKATIGLYQLNRNDLVKWACYDLDARQGNEAALSCTSHDLT